MSWTAKRNRRPFAGGEVTRRGRRLDLFGLVDVSNCNGPHVRLDWYDEHEWGATLEWGNGNSDPVWLLSLTIKRVPRWLDWLPGWSM